VFNLFQVLSDLKVITKQLSNTTWLKSTLEVIKEVLDLDYIVHLLTPMAKEGIL
jgi:hypothetical protein